MPALEPVSDASPAGRASAGSLKECQKCILHEGIQGVSVGEDGTCNHCKDPTLLPIHPIPEASRRVYEADLELALRNARGQGARVKTSGEYDVVIGLSGGKDSTFLLHALLHNYGLKVLPVAVNTGFLPKVALENIQQACQALGVECLQLDGVTPHFLELYRWLFAHRRDPYPQGSILDEMLTGRVCPLCSDLLEGFIIQEAAARRIPLVLFGLSPDQNRRFTYEIPGAVLARSWTPGFVQASPEAFSPEFRAAWWDPSRFSTTPRVLFPYHAWPYNESEVIATVAKLGLIPPGKADPLLTNCDVVWAFSVYDFRVYGCNAYAFPIARLVREGMAERSRFKKILADLKECITQGVFRGPEVRHFYRQLGYSLKEIFSIAEAEKVRRDA